MQIHRINRQVSQRIGELLVSEGFLQAEDLQRALDIQKQDADEAAMPLGELMRKHKLITDEQLQTLLNHPDLRRRIGSLLIQEGILDEEQIEATAKNKKPTTPIGQALVRNGLIKKDILDEFLKMQEDGIRIGELAFRLNMISRRDLDTILGVKSMHRTLGEILCDLNMIGSEDLNFILEKYNKKLKLGEILLRQGVIKEVEFQDALREQGQTNQPLGRVLIQKELISVDQLYNALSRQYNIPYRILTEFSFDSKKKQSLTRIISERYAQRHKVLPLSLEEKKLLIGVCHPKSLEARSDLKSMLGDLQMDIILINEGKYNELFTTLYGKVIPGAKGPEKAAKTLPGVDLVEIDLQEARGEDGHANIYGGTDMMAEQVVDYIIKYGIVNGASDIHLEQDREKTSLRYRLDGVCQDHNPAWLEEKLQEMPGAIISRIKVMSNLDIAEKRLPQDGVFRVNYFDRASNKRFDLDFRVATCPAIVGENITIRILDSRKAKVGLDNLNHSDHVLNPLKRLFKSAAGMILVCGPTGSGKSSTLYAALQYIYSPGIKIITAEDPIEYSFPGIMQTQIRPKINLSFARLLRSFLRLDPDVILVGEIRDNETARIGFDAAQTGHLLLSTIHTNDAISSVSRLLDLDVEYNQIASSLIGVLAQRLVRRNCEKCVREYKPPRSEWRLFFKEYPDHLKFFRGIGCRACGFTGYSGRTVISELFEMTRDIALALSTGIGEKEIKQLALEGGMQTMIDDGLSKLNVTTLAEIIRVTPMEMIKEFSSRQRGLFERTGESSTNGDGLFNLPFTADVKMVISDPESEWLMIDKMYEKYQMLIEKVGKSSNGADASLFREFIYSSYLKVCRQYKCSKVTFFLAAGDYDVEIAAAPKRERS
jgi:type IV pilus assembly protein PilB